MPSEVKQLMIPPREWVELYRLYGAYKAKAEEILARYQVEPPVVFLPQ